MVLFVKRTFAIKVTSASRTDQGVRGGRKMEENLFLGSTSEGWTSLIPSGMGSLQMLKKLH